MQKLPEHIEKQLAHFQEQNSFRTLSYKSGLIDFASNDYLGLARESQTVNEESPEFPFGSTGSRLLTGHAPIHSLLETIGAMRFCGESALLFNSGYMANLGVLSALPTRNDTLHFDAAVHASIKDGMRLSLAKKVHFRHNDLSHLEQNLKKGSGSQFVVVESLYSMDGDFSPINELADLCRKYQAYLILDEAHTTGLVGPEGAGWAVERNCHQRVWLRIHTFGKAVGRHGAMVIASREVRDYLINTSRPFIYTTAMSPVMAGELKVGLDLITGTGAEKGRLKIRELREHLSTLLGKKGTSGPYRFFSPIYPWIVPGNDKVKALAACLEKAGFDVRPILAPTVPEGEERLRIVLHSFNTMEQVEALAEVLR